MRVIGRLLFFLMPACLWAQYPMTGTVRDAASHAPLAFASVSVEGKVQLTDFDGKFTFEATQPTVLATISYVGYQKQKLAFVTKRFQTVSLVLQVHQLENVVVTRKENPANTIIREAIKRKTSNDPQQVLRTFGFKSYQKLIVTAQPDSINPRIDTNWVRKPDGVLVAKADSSSYRFRQMVDQRHLFAMEKSADIAFANERLKETLRGLRMSGFSQPVYEAVAFNLQSFSVYDNKYELFETKYKSPIARDAFADYYYRLLDTVALSGRKAYVIYFLPKRKYRKNGLQGLLYLDAETYAVAKAVMRLRTVLDVTAIHEFDYLSEQQLWFPSHKQFKVAKGRNDEDIRILGETLQFDADDSDSNKRARQSSDYTYLQSDSWFFDRQYNQPLTVRKPAIATVVKDEAIQRPASYWQQFPMGKPDPRVEPTYVALDSLARRKKVETKLRIGRRLLNGYVPLGAIDLDLRYLLSYNNYEGFRLGAGGITNDHFSDIFRIEGYTAYGTKDGHTKYNLGGAVRIGRFSNSWIGASYTDDVREIASTSFAIDKRVFKLYDPRPINLSTFYAYQSWRGYIETRIIPRTESIWQLSTTAVDPLFAYTFINDGKAYNRYRMTTAMVSLQWNPFSDFMQTPKGRIETEKRYPKFTFQFTKSLPGILGNDFDFAKADFRTEYQKKYLNGQKTAVIFEAGCALGDVPLTHLYNTAPNNLTKDNLLQRVTLAGKNSFETMYFNEFFSSQYVFLQLKHGFGRIGLFRKVRPTPVLVTRMAWGDLKHPEQHEGIAYKTLTRGYFESGLELNQIFKGFGLSGFYRYGPNQLPRFEDNISLKISFMLDLGF